MNPTASTSPSSRTWRIGLTGGIGSGKSTVAGMLRELGAAVIDADAISRGLTAAGGAALPEIARQFGTHMIGADGALDRSAMRQLVFADPAARQRLEAIIHPLVGQQTAERAQAALAQGCRVLVHDVPLLVEAGERWRRQLDRVWVVDCEEATQRQRVMARVPMSIIHGWYDELIPAEDVVGWARARGARLLLVDDGHRLSANVEASADAFGDLLGTL